MACIKLEHGSEQVARNAVALHFLLLPHCPGFTAYPCGDHWHAGHDVANGGRPLCDTRHAGWEQGRPPRRDTLQQ